MAKEPSEGSKASMATNKVSTARASVVWWVEWRYILQWMNKDREKQQVGNVEHKEASDAWKDVGKHIC